ncbi:MAG: Pr6Pr family membrane protein [Erysipelotrichaceae bacterium]
MYIKNQKSSLVFKITIVLVALIGQIIYVSSYGFQQWFYFTHLSNILALVYFGFASVYLFKRIQEPASKLQTFLPRVKGGVIIAVTVTLIVYWALLHGRDFSMDADIYNSLPAIMKTPIPNYIVHLVVPVLTICDWLLFDVKGHFEKYDFIKWLGIPYLYFGFAIVVAATGYTFPSGSHYPYFFIDFDVLGVQKVALYVVALTGFFLILSYLFYLLDRKLGKEYLSK